MKDYHNMVSIIMPAFNGEKYIKEAIKSVIDQEYINWELIVINDCSTDSTKEIVLEFIDMDQRINLINLSKNRGITYARNRGISESKGRFVAFLDCDDMWKPNKLMHQISFMKKNNYQFTFTEYEWITMDGEVMNKKIIVPTEVKYKELLGVNYIGCLTVIIDRYKIINLEMPNIKHEDYATWLNILKNEQISAYGLKESLAFYRKNPNSISSNKFKTIGWTWNIYRVNQNFNKIQSLLYISKFIVKTTKKNIIWNK